MRVVKLFGRPFAKISYRRTLLILGLVAIIAIVAFVYKAVANPAVGTIKNVQANATIPKIVSTKEARGKYISFSYPSTYSVSASSKPGGTQLEAFDFINRNTTPFSYINISVLSLPSGKLTDDGSYNFRLHNPSTYTPDTWTVNGVSVPLMIDTSGGYAKAGYVVNGNFVAEISVRGGGSLNLRQLDNDMRSVLTSLKWR